MKLSTSWRSQVLAVSLGAALVPTVVAAESASHACCPSNAYVRRNLVSDVAGRADVTDPNLVNAWGIAFNPFGGAVWISDNGTGLSTLYDGNGAIQSLVVTVPTPPGNTGMSKPTGIVANDSSQFVVSNGTASGPSPFIFATEDGTISGWSPGVNFTQAILAVDNSATGAIYKGLALAGNGTGLFLYATDFHNGKIDVFDSTFHPAHLAGSFEDPTLPRGFAPFGIQNINGSLYVTYAKQDADREDDVPGKGLGYVNIFDANGRLIRRFISRGRLNAPWGLAMAPAGFGKFSNRILVGNFGDGSINAYDPATGHFEGRLERPDGRPVQIDGLWGLSFGNGVLNQPTDTLFFTSGPAHEAHGLYGRLDLAPGSCRGVAAEPELAPESEPELVPEPGAN